MNSVLQYSTLLLCFLINLLPVSVYALNTEIIADSRFELGAMNVDIQRYPRYPETVPESLPYITPPDPKGKRCLLLPALPEGGYRLTYEPAELNSKEQYHFQAQLQSDKKTDVRVEIRSGSRRVERKVWSVKNDTLDMNIDFIAANKDKNKLSVHALRIWIQPKGDACLNFVSLRGPATTIHPQSLANMTPDQPTGVYGLGETASMNVSISAPLTQPAYQITDPVTQTIIKNKTLVQEIGGKLQIPLPTNKRGFFRVDLLDNMTGKMQWQRSYVVIKRKTNDAKISRRYGLAMEEEHSIHTMVYAQAMPDDIYRLAADIGAGSMRIFALASPEKLSNDGIRYDFRELDRALDLAAKYDLSVMLELGSNELHKIPKWLRTNDDNENTIDLEAGFHTKRLQKAFARTAEKGSYLSLKKYRLYLQQLFKHLAGRVDYYEIWNEPGHKLKAKDYLRIAEATRSVQQKFAPHAKLLGPTSSAVQEQGKGRDSAVLPEFVSKVMSADVNNSIDILSYHSRHAFPFMGKAFDRRNQETGFAQRLQQVLKKSGAGELSIWDTERGVPWKSYHPQRTDIWQGRKGPDAWVGSYDHLEPARRLPGIFSAAWAGGVERLFWFNVDPGTSTIARTQVRWGFFDADMEPMPHIAAYDAYSELVGNGTYSHHLDKTDGTRCYVFKRDDKTILVAFNWKEQTGLIHIESPGSQIIVKDIMGNEIAQSQNQYQLSAGSWAQYVIIDALPENITIK